MSFNVEVKISKTPNKHLIQFFNQLGIKYHRLFPNICYWHPCQLAFLDLLPYIYITKGFSNGNYRELQGSSQERTRVLPLESVEVYKESDT